jgi:membrane-bound lytic murein transglycosylase D
VEYQVVVLDSFYTPTTLERVLGVEADLLRAHNLALRSSVWSGKKRIPKGYALRVPVNPSLPEAQVALASVPPADRYVGQTRDRTHTVRKGETVASIAKRFGLSQRELLAANGMKNGKGLRAGQTLRLPDGETGGRIPPAEPLAAAPPQHAAPVGPDGKYHVRLGDTAGAIARRLGVSEAELVAANGLSSGDHIRAGDVLTVPGRAPAQRARTYSVRKGDSIRSIAAKLGVDPADLIAANALRDGDRIRTGQVLRVPASGTAAAPATATYKVKKGDTLSSIARRFRVKPSALIAANSLSDRDEIRAGQVLRIP